MNAGNETYKKAYQEFCKRLVEARHTAALNQKDVSLAFGKSKSFMSKCEQGERRVDFVELLMLAKIYRKDLSFFVVL